MDLNESGDGLLYISRTVSFCYRLNSIADFVTEWAWVGNKRIFRTILRYKKKLKIELYYDEIFFYYTINGKFRGVTGSSSPVRNGARIFAAMSGGNRVNCQRAMTSAAGYRDVRTLGRQWLTVERPGNVHR